MPFNPYIAVFAVGGLIVLATKPSPSWEGVGIGLFCVLASGVAKLLWKPTPPPKNDARKAVASVAVQAPPAASRATPLMGLPAGAAPVAPHPALLATVPTQARSR